MLIKPIAFLPFSLPSASSLCKVPNQPNNGNEMESKGVQFPSRGAPNKIRPTLNSIRQTDVDTLVVRTQSRVGLGFGFGLGLGLGLDI